MYFITTKRMLEVCFSAHPNIQYRTQRNILRLLFCPLSIIWKKLPTSGFSYKQSQNGYKTVSKTFIFVDGVTEWGYT